MQTHSQGSREGRAVVLFNKACCILIQVLLGLCTMCAPCCAGAAARIGLHECGRCISTGEKMGKEAISLAGQCWEHVPLELFMLYFPSVSFPCATASRHFTFHPSTSMHGYTPVQSQMQARTPCMREKQTHPFLPGCRKRQRLVPASLSSHRSDAPGRGKPRTHRAAERG